MRNILKTICLSGTMALLMAPTASHAQSNPGQLYGTEQFAYCLSQMFAQPRDPQCFGDVEATNDTDLMNTGEPNAMTVKCKYATSRTIDPCSR